MTRKFHPLVPAKSCTGRAQKGTAALMSGILQTFDGTYDWGIYNCRPVRGGRSLSHHSEGRAADLGIPLIHGKPNTKVGDPIVEILLNNAWELGLDHLIWNGKIWSAKNPNGATYRGSTPTLRHEDHIHAGQAWVPATNLTEATVLDILEGEAMAFLPLRQGDNNSDVAAIQALMNRAFNARLTSDGNYGPKTAAAIAQYLPDPNNKDGSVFFGNRFDDLLWALSLKAAQTVGSGGGKDSTARDLANKAINAINDLRSKLRSV